jgi:hypothetical protein
MEAERPARAALPAFAGPGLLSAGVALTGCRRWQAAVPGTTDSTLPPPGPMPEGPLPRLPSADRVAC